jgi:molybdopterin converting factor small subunit
VPDEGRQPLCGAKADIQGAAKEWNEKMGDFGNRLGDVVEYTFVPDAIMRKFAELGYEIETTARDYTITGADRHSIAEVDILLQDGDTVILVEIKMKLTKAHIDEHVQRMQKVRDTKRFEDKALVGAAVGAVVSGETKDYALQQGMYVLEQTGEAIQIMPRDRSFVPRKW